MECVSRSDLDLSNGSLLIIGPSSTTSIPPLIFTNEYGTSARVLMEPLGLQCFEMCLCLNLNDNILNLPINHHTMEYDDHGKNFMKSFDCTN
jgi:hypothetical protein